MKRGLLLACLVQPVLLGKVGPAGAQGAGDIATSQVLFDEARALTKEGKWAEACPKFEESNRLVPTNNTLYYLADCQEHAGKTATAWASFVAVADKAKAANEPAKETFSRKRADALLPKLCRLAIKVPKETAGLVVRRSGVELSKAQWGFAAPLDPGTYVVDASAPGFTAWSKSETLASPGCNGTTTSIEVPGLEKTPAEVTAPKPTDTPTPAPPLAAAPTAAPQIVKPERSAPPADTTLPRGSFQRTAGLTAGGVGLVTVGIGLILRSSGKSQYDEAIARCDLPGPLPCRDADVDDALAGRSRRDVGWVVIGTGSAVLVGGVVLFLTAPKGTTGSERAVLAPWVGGGVTGIRFQAGF